MKLGALLGFLVGTALAAWLLTSYGWARILNLLGHAGWLGLGVVIAFHLTQVIFSAAAWRTITGPAAGRPNLAGFIRLRWIREGVNNLLPVAQIGGEFVTAGLLRRYGMKLTAAIAGSVCDLTMEMVTQIAFTILGLGLLVQLLGHRDIGGVVAGGIAVALAVAAAFVAAQWLGLARLIEAGLVRLGRATGWGGFGEVEGLHAAITGLYRAPARLGWAAFYHAVSWLLGGVEVCLALYVLGRPTDIGAGLVIESLGQALKAVGFAIPGALGVQEGGYIVVCGLFGIGPDLAIALSLTKRLREVVLGVPALAAWRWRRGAPASPAGAAP